MKAHMCQKLSSIEKIAVLVPSCCMAVFSLLVCLRLNFAPAYPDFIVGQIAWQAGTKFQDQLAAPVFIFTFLFSLWFFSKQVYGYRAKNADQDSEALTSQLLWWSVPAVAAFGGSLVGLPFNKEFFYLSVLGLVYLSLVGVSYSAKRWKISPSLAGLGLLTVLLIALLPLEVALIMGRLPANWGHEFELGRCLKVTYSLLGIGFCFLLMVIMVYAERFERVLPRLLFIGQSGLPLLFACFYPARLLTPDGLLTKYSTTPALKVLLAAMIVWGSIDVARRYFKFMRGPSKNFGSLLSPVALFALLMALKAGMTVAPSVNPDDYHFGEQLLGWWSYLHGVIPYVGYMPAHGVIGDDLPGMLSYFFYDGKATSIVESYRLGTLLLSLCAFLAIRRYTASIGLAFVSILFLGGGFAQSTSLNWLFLTPFLCLWLYPRLLDKPAKWLGVWIVTIPLVVLGVPPQGVLLVAASSLVAFYMVWRYWQVGDILHGRKEIGWALAVLLLLALLSPFLPMLFNAVRYVFENGLINQVAYGVPWKLSWNGGLRSGLIFEMIRMSWVIVPILCGVLLYTQRKNLTISPAQYLPTLVVLIFSLLLVPYSMGRIDPGGGSRPAIAGILGWTVLLPIAVWEMNKQRDKAIWVLLIIGMSATLNFSPPSLLNFVSSLSPRIHVGPLRDGGSAGLLNLGIGTVQDEHWDRLTRLNTLFNNKLAPGENYLDLTSRNAQYFYLDRLPKQVVTAPFNMVALSQQKRAVEQLSRNSPRLALLEGANIIHDGGGLALRNHYLYRFILDNYIPRFEDGFIIGYKKTGKDDNHELTIDIAVKNVTDERWERGIHRLEPAVIVGDPVLMPLLTVGAKVRIGMGEVRRIDRILSEENAIWFDGAAIDSVAASYSNRIQVVVSPQIEAEYNTALFQKAFAQSDFQKIPVAWGRSEKSLQKKMTLMKELNGLSPSLYQLTPNNGGYKVTGIDPSLSYDVSSLGLSGRDAGLFKFDFSCVNKSGEPRIQVFWWGDDREGPFEASSVIFTADNGPLIVPLDASPRWVALKHIKGIRIDLANSGSCEEIKIKKSGLYQRANF